MESKTLKRALVTGASEGIGRTFALTLADMGYTVTAVARNEDRLRDLMTGLTGDKHSWIQADLTKADELAKVSESLKTEHFDLLVNNAGCGGLGQFQQTPMQNHRTMIQLNIVALTTLCHDFLSRGQPGDGIINVSSLLSYIPFPPQGVYAATKAFVTSLSEALWYEHKNNDLFVMALCPGATKSEFWERAGGQNKDIPNYVMQSSEQVVKEAMKHYKKRKKPVLVTGVMNRLSGWFFKFLPTKIIMHLVSISTPGYSIK